MVTAMAHKTINHFIARCRAHHGLFRDPNVPQHFTKRKHTSRHQYSTIQGPAAIQGPEAIQGQATNRRSASSQDQAVIQGPAPIQGPTPIQGPANQGTAWNRVKFKDGIIICLLFKWYHILLCTQEFESNL